MKSRIHIIAEVGSTHEGDSAYACRMADIAKECGADSIKYQFLYFDDFYLTWLRETNELGPTRTYIHHLLEEMGLPVGRRNGDLIENPMRPLRKQQELSEAQWTVVADHAREIGLPAAASVFCNRSLKLLDSLDAPYIKIASCDLNNNRLLRAAAQTGRQLLVSTGMATLDEIEQAVLVLKEVGWNADTPPVLFHCVSVYPHKPEIANIGFIRTLRDAFGLPVGYSDHTETNTCAITALALGATWFEKHFTQDRNADGLDHAFAMTPPMLKDYISTLHDAEAALALQLPKVGTREQVTMQRARRGLWLVRDVEAGQILTDEDIAVVRPDGYMKPPAIDLVVGQLATRNLKAYEPLRPDDIRTSDQPGKPALS